jgi:hypothetical protein
MRWLPLSPFFFLEIGRKTKRERERERERKIKN